MVSTYLLLLSSHSVLLSRVPPALYFVADSFKDATAKVREFAAKMDRPFGVRYNPYTETIEVLDTKEKLVRYASNIRGEMQTLVDALSRLH